MHVVYITNESRCKRCGRIVPPRAAEKLCPGCVLAQAVLCDLKAPQSRVSRLLPSMTELEEIFQDFEFHEKIGAGATGAVYRCLDKNSGLVVAIKILAPELTKDPIFQARFEQEATVLQSLDHENIVKVLYAGQIDDYSYLVMDYVAGSNLRGILSQGQMESDEIIDLIGQLCRGLNYAHQEGVIHRDLKPENLLIDEEGRLRIADFGLAKVYKTQVINASFTATGQVLGTPHYMAPEQFENPKRVDQQADIYSVGVILYEMLTRELPIGRFPVPSERGDYSNAVNQVVLKTLAKEPEERFESVSELQSAVEVVLSSTDSGVWQAVKQIVGWQPQRVQASSWAVLSILLTILGPIFFSSAVTILNRTDKFLNHPELIDLALIMFGASVLFPAIIPVFACFARHDIRVGKPYLWGMPLVAISVLSFPFMTLQFAGTLWGILLTQAQIGGIAGAMTAFTFGLWLCHRLYIKLNDEKCSELKVFAIIVFVHILSYVVAFDIFRELEGVDSIRKVVFVKQVYLSSDLKSEPELTTPVANDFLNEILPYQFYFNYLDQLSAEDKIVNRRVLMEDLMTLRSVFLELNLKESEYVKNFLGRVCYDQMISELEQQLIHILVEHIRRHNNSIQQAELLKELRNFGSQQVTRHNK